MSMRFLISRAGKPSLCIVLMVLLLATLVFAGGSYRSEAPGQVAVRFVAGVAIVIAAMTIARPSTDICPPFLLLGAIALVPIIQLIPLPHAWWVMLPGRGVLVRALTVTGQESVWRPISWSPGTTINALFSLIVPTAVLILCAGIKDKEQKILLVVFITCVIISTIFGLIQFSGNRFSQPLIFYDYEVSGTFGNRNHFALFLALGCLAMPCWIFSIGRGYSVRILTGIGILVVLFLSIMASGSRAGLAIGGVAILIGPLIVREDVRRLISGWPRWMAPAVAVAILAFLTGAVALSVLVGRAQSIDRLLTADVSSDMRARSLPTVLEMTWTYFPVGTGMGSFDSIFRHHEPFSLLKLTYFNQAHDDVLSTILEGGLPGLIVLLLALTWWARASLAVWPSRAGNKVSSTLIRARLGSAIVAFVFAASIVDYPARTPMMMAVLALAAAWLAWGWSDVRRD